MGPPVTAHALSVLVVADCGADGSTSASVGRVVEGLARVLDGRDDVEVVLVDGRPGAAASDVGTARPVRFRVVAAPGSHRGALRNLAVAHSVAPLVWLLGDDVVPRPGCLEAHLRAHAAAGRADLVVVGPARFPTALREDPFRRWLEDEGSLFGGSFTRADPRIEGFFYGANTSLPRALLDRAGPFRADFDGPVLDDDEMGRRLRALGARIVYEPAAEGVHDHAVGWAERRAAVREHGRAAARRDATADTPVPWPADVTRSPAALAWRARVAAVRARLLGGEARRAHAYRRRLEADFVAGYAAARRRRA